MADSTPEVGAALAVVRAAGYVAIRAKSYQRAQERQRVAAALRRAAEEDKERMQEWVDGRIEEDIRLRNRLTFVYGVARAHGATAEELAGELL